MPRSTFFYLALCPLLQTLALISLVFISIFSWCTSFLSIPLLCSNLSSSSSGGVEFGDKSTGSWGVLGKPTASRRSTSLLRRAVIILVTCYQKACSSVYLQLLLSLGAHFNAWGRLFCNEFRNTGEPMQEKERNKGGKKSLANNQ